MDTRTGWKGTAFDGPDDPSLPMFVKRMRTEAAGAWIDAHNERFRVVATCDACNEPLIAEEAEQHAIDHLEDGDARVLAGMYARASEATRARFIGWLDGRRER